MKNKKTELDVDSIGSQEPLTKEEEMAISNYLRSKELRKNSARKSTGGKLKKKV